MMRKIFKSLLLLFILMVSVPAFSQYYGSYYGSGYYNNLADYTYFWKNAPPTDKTIFGIDQFFGALDQGIRQVRQSRAMDRYIHQNMTAIENRKSVQKYYTEGVPPFAPRTPDGKPRPKDITWQDVETIDGEGFVDND